MPEEAQIENHPEFLAFEEQVEKDFDAWFDNHIKSKTSELALLENSYWNSVNNVQRLYDKLFESYKMIMNEKLQAKVEEILKRE